MISIKEYAQSKGVSYEAVRRQVRKFSHDEKEFKKHIQENPQRGTGTLLDDWAIDYLDKHRLPRPVIVRASEDETQRELENLRSQLAKAMTELNSAKDTIIRLQDEKLALTEEKSLAIEDKTRATTLLEQKDKDLEESKAENQKLNQEIATKNQELEQRDKELNSYQKTIFGLYKKINI